MDVEATRAIRWAEVGASRTMRERREKRFEIRPDWLAADTTYGNAENLGWLVEKRGIIPFIAVIDKSDRNDADVLHDIFRDYALEALADPDAVLVIDGEPVKQRIQ
ncbi:hypothetical protein IT41_07250 [Paracoccus halophilus]|nr:hypothetical protein IT41_07250 [Paracoccus halophilus]